MSSLKRVRHCGRVPRSNDEGVALRVTDGHAGFAGLQHCGSVWADPVCAGRVLLHRALEIGAVLGRAIEAGYALGFVTLTMRHHSAQPLELLWAAGQGGWRRVVQGKAWTRHLPNIVGFVRVWEVNYGANGWHVHVHCVLVLERGADLEEIASGMFNRWSRGLQAKGLEAPRRIGQDWHLVEGERAAEELGGYLAKMADPAVGLGLELTHSMPGRSRSDLKTQPHWAVLDRFVQTGDADALALWHEWERVSKGKRQVGWSKGLRERFAPEVEELSDEEVVALELGSSNDDVLRMDAVAWRELVSVPGRMVELLERAEISPEFARRSLDEWGIRYETC